MNALIFCLFTLAGLINLIPIVGAISDAELASLYGIINLSPELSLLLRHRAILLGIVGTLCIHAAFQPGVRLLATLAGLSSMASFLFLLLQTETSNAALTRVAWADVAAMIALIIGLSLHLVRPKDHLRTNIKPF